MKYFARAPIVVRYGGALVLASAGLMGLLHKWEDGPQLQMVVYADKLAGGLPTACNGITAHTSPVPVVVGEVWSAEKCEEVARTVVLNNQVQLLECITTQVSQNTFDALSSHAHNVGVASTCVSRALRLINEGKLEEGCRALAFGPSGQPVWAYTSDGKGGLKFVQGLHNRRLDEMRTCLRPDE